MFEAAITRWKMEIGKRQDVGECRKGVLRSSSLLLKGAQLSCLIAVVCGVKARKGGILVRKKLYWRGDLCALSLSSFLQLQFRSVNKQSTKSTCNIWCKILVSTQLFPNFFQSGKKLLKKTMGNEKANEVFGTTKKIQSRSRFLGKLFSIQVLLALELLFLYYYNYYFV